MTPAAASFPFLSPDDAELRMLLEGDLFTFSRVFLENDKLIEPLHRPLARFAEETFSAPEVYSVVMIPRAHYKTTLCDVSFVPWIALKYPDIRICVASSTDKLARNVFTRIKRILESPDAIRLWPDVLWAGAPPQSVNWSVEQGVQLCRSMDDPVPTIQWTSSESGTVGQHYHLIVLDDYVDLENSRTWHKRAMTTTRFRQLRNQLRRGDQFFPSGGRFMNLCTPWHYDDANMQMIDPKGDYAGNVRVFRRGIFGEPGVMLGDPGATEENLILPTEFCVERSGPDDDRVTVLEISKSLGEHAPAQLYCDPRPDSSKEFSKSDIQWYEVGKAPSLDSLNLLAAYDPNRKDLYTSDPCALVIAGWDCEGHIWVLDAITGKPMGEEQIHMICGAMKRWGPSKLLVEATNYQNQLIHWIVPEFLKQKIPVSIMPVERGNANKPSRIRAMLPMVQSQALHIPNNASGKALFDEMVNYGSWKNDDMVEALSDIYRYGAPPLSHAPSVMVPRGARALDSLDDLIGRGGRLSARARSGRPHGRAYFGRAVR